MSELAQGRALASRDDAPVSRRRLGLLRLFRGNWLAVVGAVSFALILVVAAAAPWLASQRPDVVNVRQRMLAPSAAHWLGTDQVGHDLLSQIIWGSRVSLMVGVAAVAIAAVAGVTIGLLSGYFGGWVDRLLMGLMDVLLAFPLLLLAMALMAVMGQSLTNLIIAVGVAGVPQYARLVRGSVFAVRDREFVQAELALGARDPHIIRRHILPNVTAPIIVMATISVASAILTEAGLSFLGMGDPTQPTWGSIVAAGRPYIQNAPWISTFGGLAITVTVIALNLLGDGLRDMMDPRLKRNAI
ncbi:MAG: ABC transporter permease [Mycobacterium leprae]